MAGLDWLLYENRGATRNWSLSQQMQAALGQFVPQMGLQMEVFSGGQPASGPRRTGSHRHDLGNAADVFFRRGGRRLDWNNPADVATFQEIVRRGKEAGLTGFGAGPGYMRPGSMHLGFGSPAVWGAGGKGSTAPDWLREAYGSGAPRASTLQAAAPQTQPGIPPMAPAATAQAQQPAGPSSYMQGVMQIAMGGGNGNWMSNRSYSTDALIGDILAGHNPLRRFMYQKIMGLFA